MTEPDVIADGVDLSPDGNQLAYTLSRPGEAHSELWISDLTSKKSRRLASDDQERLYPQWSRDGRRLAYMWGRSVPGGGQGGMAVWDLEAGEEQLIMPPQRGDFFVTDWSPDGRSVLANTTVPRPPFISLTLWPFPAPAHASAKPTVLATDADFDLWEASYSPDGQWIAFNAVSLRRPGVSTIEVMPSGGAARTQWTALTSDRDWADKPRWAPDGHAVYYILLRGSFYNVWGSDSTPPPESRKASLSR